jgi:hypothetical protein
LDYCAATTQGADARPVADAREALTDSVVEQWLDRQGNDSGQGLCDMYTSAVRDGYRLARSTLTDFYATRDVAPIDTVVWQETDEEGTPLWGENTFSANEGMFEHERALGCIAAPAKDNHDRS